MKLITVCSESHVELLEQHLLPSLPSTLTPTVIKTVQRSAEIHGWYPEFIAAMREKMSIVLEHTRTENSPFIYCDVDIRFNSALDPVPTLMSLLEENKLDMLCQRDGENVCAGFMVLCPTEKNANYLQAVLDYMDANPSKCDQLAFNELYRSTRYPTELKPFYRLLDINVGFGNTNHLQPGVLWTPENNIIELHKDLVKRQFMWHANHTIGLKHKINMLDRFKIACEEKQ